MQGRGGKGNIYAWATGNGGMYNDTCSCDGYVSSPYTLSVGSINDKGLSTYYSEICPATMAVVFTGGSHTLPGEVDYRNPTVKVVCLTFTVMSFYILYYVTLVGKLIYIHRA